MSAAHTATPFAVNPVQLNQICTADGKTLVATVKPSGGDERPTIETAEFIVRACNAHDDLVSASKDAMHDMVFTALMMALGETPSKRQVDTLIKAAKPGSPVFNLRTALEKAGAA